MARADFRMLGARIKPGERALIDIPLPGLYTDTPMHMQAHVLHGRQDGPVLFVSAAVHGDEINGVEIIRRLLLQPRLKRLRGTLIAVPIVNVLGFHNRSRYLPDRRDLNRGFPGRRQGTLAGRLAHAFMEHVVRHSNVGIDLHTAAIHRDNLPQVRADLSNAELDKLARAFAAPVLLHSAPPEGALRWAAAEEGVPILVYEAGEALRFDEAFIRVGLRGVVNVMAELGMLKLGRSGRAKASTLLRTSNWIRAPRSGILRSVVRLGDMVSEGAPLGVVGDPADSDDVSLLVAPFSGVVIGRTNLPLVYEGEAVFHVGRTRQTSKLEQQLTAVQDHDQLSLPELVEEPEIV